jgi:hypothetical protein
MTNHLKFFKKTALTFAVVILAACLWFPVIHLFFKKDISQYKSSHAVAPMAQALANTHLALWRDPKLRKIELDKMQYNNPEWDFMSRTYFVLALANMALLDSSYTNQSCSIIDAIIENTLMTETERGFQYFLLDYGRRGGWVNSPEGSIFIDGEIALMMAARRAIREKESLKPLLQKRVQRMVRRMKESPIFCDESYPNECWIFCNTVGLAAIKMSDKLDKTDHSLFFQKWLRQAKDKLVDKKTGLLISAFTIQGKPLATGPGPEGSSIWMACHMLQIIDPVFAREKYKKAKSELGGSLFLISKPPGFPGGLPKFDFCGIL